MNWPFATIGQVCLPTDQRDPTAAPEKPFRYIDISAIDKDAKRITTAPVLSGAEAPSQARKAVRAGDVLVSTVRPNLNVVALVPDDLDGEIASTGFCVLRANPKLAVGEFIFYRCLTPEFVNALVAQMRGANYSAVSDGVVKRTETPLPAPKEQRRIVELLQQADELRRKRAEADGLAERILPALFHKMFGDPATNPKKFDKRKLERLLTVKSGVSLPAKDMAPDGRYAVYGGNGIAGRHDAFMFEQPVIVIGRVGVYCGVVHLTEPCSWVTDNALYVADIHPDLDASLTYLSEALKAAKLNQYAGRAAQPLVSGGRIYPIEILVPPLALQQQFAARCSVIDRIACEQAVSRSNVETLFRTILHGAFTGELTAKWREAHLKELVAEMEQQARLLRKPTDGEELERTQTKT